MKNLFVAAALLLSSTAFTQDKPCTLWLGDTQDSASAIKQIAERYLEMQTKLAQGETSVSNIQELKDDNGLALIKIWMKPKKVVVAGAMTTTYVISSYKITSLSDKIDLLYNALKSKVMQCTSESTAANTLFGVNKMVIEKQGGDFSKKNLPMATLTVTAK